MEMNLENPQEYIARLGKRARLAERAAAGLSARRKNEFLRRCAGLILAHTDEIIRENARDCAQAEKEGMAKPMLDRLMLDSARIAQLSDAAEKLAALEDPVGSVISAWKRENGLQIVQRRVPLGVIGIIYEARPNVTVDAALLCVKAGNAVILRGGKEALATNKALVSVLRLAAEKSGIDPDIIQLVEDPSREAANSMMLAAEYIDVLIPRGGAGLIQSVKKNAKVPVIETGAGNCHAYVDRAADFEKAIKVVYNAKVSRPSVCNAIETLLVHAEIAEDFLPLIGEEFVKAGVKIYGCEKTRAILGEAVLPATEVEYETEFDDYIIAVKVVESLEEAVEHIDRYSTGHSEVILTEDIGAANRFLSSIRSAVVYVNASTRFTDGGEFGFGAEIGISTQKLHARGPMGLKELTTTQYVVLGDGQVR